MRLLVSLSLHASGSEKLKYHRVEIQAKKSCIKIQFVQNNVLLLE